MLFSSRLSLSVLLGWCRALKHGLDAGLSPVRVFRHQAKSGPVSARPLAERLADRLESGESLADAMAPDRTRFPQLFRELVAVGEHTGRLHETFATLEEYFETVQTARKDLIRALIWPAIMYVAAILIITVLILVMGMIPGGFDPLGFGLTGATGAMTFLFGAFTVTAIGIFLLIQLRDDEDVRSRVEGAILPVPGIGACLRAFALQRFSMAMHMTAEAGLRADQTIKLSLRATANRAYQWHSERAAKLARNGQEIGDVLEGCGTSLFPDDFLDAVRVGDESGQLAEVMAKLAKQYREESARKLKILTMAAGGLVYMMVAMMVIMMIFRIVSAISGIYDDAMRGL